MSTRAQPVCGAVGTAFTGLAATSVLAARYNAGLTGMERSGMSELKPLLAPSKRNWLSPGCKVQMKDGEILTVKSLEFRYFVAVEKVGYIPKKDIHTIID